jgi:hypothetical protein
MHLVNLKDILDIHFPGALPGPAVHWRLIEILGDYGFMPENTILGTSICSDEVNSLKGTLVDTMKEHWGTHFPLGGIGGAPYVGKTGFFAFSHHVPENGNVLVFFGPHVGVTATGEIGKCLRHGQSAASTACGACIAAYQQSLAGGMDPDMALDMQQSWLRGQIAPHVDRITAAQNPMAELAKVSYTAASKKLKSIVNTDFGSGYLALVGGIQLNMPSGFPDYFLPCDFAIQRGCEAPENLLGSLTRQVQQRDRPVGLRGRLAGAVAHTRAAKMEQCARPTPTGILNLKSALHLNFDGALPGPEVHQRLSKILGEYGFVPENTILGTSICSDEVNTLKGTLVDTMQEHWGTNFHLGGIGGAPYVGKTGFLAFSHHVPESGNVLIFFGPHVGVTATGEVGMCLRHGQSNESFACGACQAAYKQSLAGNVDEDMALDMQQSWLRGQIAPHVDRIAAAQNPMAELAKVSYEAVLKKLKSIVNTDFGSGHLALVGGIQINMPSGYPDYFLPCDFTIQRGSEAPKDLLSSLLGRQPCWEVRRPKAYSQGLPVLLGKPSVANRKVYQQATPF